MTMPAAAVTPPDQRLVTVQEALEPLYLKLEIEAGVRLIKAAMEAGWSAEEAVSAIEELRRQDVVKVQH